MTQNLKSTIKFVIKIAGVTIIYTVCHKSNGSVSTLSLVQCQLTTRALWYRNNFKLSDSVLLFQTVLKTLVRIPMLSHHTDLQSVLLVIMQMLAAQK